MTNEEILARVKKMRSEIKEGHGYVCRFDETDVDSFNNFLIWDDENLLLYCITANTELGDQFLLPFKIKAFDYRMLEFISTLISESPSE